jgi:hypothetical protein
VSAASRFDTRETRVRILRWPLDKLKATSFNL